MNPSDEPRPSAADADTRPPTAPTPVPEEKGVIAWFASNPVAANLLMLVIMVAGAFTTLSIKKEIFPEFSLDMLAITVPYRGGTPQEVEEGVVIKVEEAIQDIPGIKRITAAAMEGAGRITVEILPDYDLQKVLNQIKVRVDGISTFPAETERPIIEELTTRNEVMWVNLAGDVDEPTLKRLAEKVRNDIVSLPGVTQAEIYGVRRFEIAIEVSETRLREYGLSFDDVARAVRRSSINLPAGSIKTEGGEVLIRTNGQAYTGDEYAALVLQTRPDGTRITVGDVADVIDGFEDSTVSNTFNGERSASIRIMRVGEQSALDVAAKVRTYVDAANEELPDGVTLTVWADGSRFLKERLNMLLKNGAIGLLLVFVSLALFLRLSLAFWVCLGIPLSFLGTLFLMPTALMGISINMITLFGFLVVLGIVVDDAIVVGENVYTTCQKEGFGLASTIKGAREVAVPVTYGVLTTVVAFIPMLMVPGVNGKIWSGIALVVIGTLLFSLVESKLILPAHLSFLKRREQDETKLNAFERFQRVFGKGLQWWIERVYQPSLRVALEWRYATLSAFLGLLVVAVFFVASGHVRFVFFPNIESDFVDGSVELAQGTPAAFTQQMIRKMHDAVEEVRREGREKDGQELVKNVLSYTRSEISFAFVLELAPSEERTIPASEIARRWREKVGEIPGATNVTYTGTIANSGRPIDLQLTSNNIEQLEAAALELKERLRDYAGVYDVSESSGNGKTEVRLSIKSAAEALGLSLTDLARQVRQGFYGEEAQRIQRGRDDVRVMVRYPEKERRSLGYLEAMHVRTPDGGEVPFSYVASAETGRGYNTIRRVDRKRVINVTAEIDKNAVDPDIVRNDVQKTILPEVLAKYPGVRSSQEGEAREQAESMAALQLGGVLAVFLIYALMAIPLKSYTQPVMIMTAIPFGIVGAIAGHVLMGIPVSILSLCGIIALAGVAVNDSLVMVDFVNNARARGLGLFDAVSTAGVARFRAILLTSVTTFAGLSPLLLEKSLQAQILIPMAVSLAFGVLFATAITLMLIPCLYLVFADIAHAWARTKAFYTGAPVPPRETGSQAVV
ncbi:efflux RND transporter permease subunit [Opitutales bacterium ASA1]|uniref:efflux RND transporter permease subunit n=1 Tax=Congregicoccus parvus TaxID=3081749 RepID=UPI002B2E1502|nr:efflux RND transporter permease subunit [Opitutales bacterium ASA1]